MPRAIWRGAISFGMVSIPVKLYTATENHDISFRQLAEEDLKPIRYLRWSPTLDREVQYSEIKRGYEYAKDQFVILEDEDFEGLPVPSKHTISISQFVDASEIDPIYHEKPYYLDPDEAGVKPYTLLLRAMEEKGLIAIGKLALRQKEQLVVIRPHQGHLNAEILLYPDEVRPYEGTDVSDVKVSKDELKMAFALIDMLHEPFDPAEFTDEYRDILMNMITTKLEGGEVVSAEAEESPTQTVDLMAALRASVEATRARRGSAKRTGSAPSGAEDESASESPADLESADAPAASADAEDTQETAPAARRKRSSTGKDNPSPARSRKRTTAR